MVTVTGTCESRLNEVRKYKTTGSLSDRYFTSLTPNNDGINLFETTEGVIFVYYINGVTYTDTIENGVTTTIFQLTSLGYDEELNFTNTVILKDFAKDNVVDVPEVNSEVFITRQSISVFEDQIRMNNISDLSELLFYAGGSYFNIVNNI